MLVIFKLKNGVKVLSERCKEHDSTVIKLNVKNHNNLSDRDVSRTASGEQTVYEVVSVWGKRDLIPIFILLVLANGVRNPDDITFVN